MTSNGIRLVCFDLGGVLIRICRSWTEGVAAAGLPLRGDSELKSSFFPGWENLILLHQTGKLDLEDYAARLSTMMDGRYRPDEIRAIHDAWMLGEYEGVGKVIDRIHAAGIETACLSNTNHAHWMRMPGVPVVQSLRHRLASHELGLHKPDAAIFHEFERRTGFGGAEILYFDDLPENVNAAAQVGWIARQVDPLTRTDLQIDEVLRASGIIR